MVWQPARRRIERLESAAKCESTDRLIRRGAPILALAGSRAAWLQLTGGNRLETILKSATLARPTPVWIVAKAASELSVLAVDAGRIAARTESGIRLLTAGGRVLQDLPVRAPRQPHSPAIGWRCERGTQSRFTTPAPGSHGPLRCREGRQTPGPRRRHSGHGLGQYFHASPTRRSPDEHNSREPNNSGPARARGALLTAGARRVAFMPMREVLRRLGAPERSRPRTVAGAHRRGEGSRPRPASSCCSPLLR
jgi:hypothetical protein